MDFEEQLSEGEVLSGRYKICELVGIGGMGSVYRALDSHRGGQEVAIKTLKNEFSDDAVYVERFVREVELLNKIDHPNVVRTFDIGSENGLLYYVMEFVRGTSLEEILEHGTFPLQDIPKLIIQICEGLHAIHNAEIIHRDLKPGNVLLLDNGGLKITDFGVARPKVSNLTRKDQRVGSIWYMPPEAWQGRTLTRTADLYSLGILLYECVTGVLPFEGDTPSELMRMHLSSKVVPPSRLKSETPAWLNSLVVQLLAKVPTERPQTALEVAKYITQHTGTTSSKTNLKALSESGSKPKITPQSLKDWRVENSQPPKAQPGPAKKTAKKKKKPKFSPHVTKIIALILLIAIVVLLVLRSLVA